MSYCRHMVADRCVECSVVRMRSVGMECGEDGMCGDGVW